MKDGMHNEKNFNENLALIYVGCALCNSSTYMFAGQHHVT